MIKRICYFLVIVVILFILPSFITAEDHSEFNNNSLTKLNVGDFIDDSKPIKSKEPIIFIDLE